MSVVARSAAHQRRARRSRLRRSGRRARRAHGDPGAGRCRLDDLVVLDTTGVATALHHHALIETGRPLLASVPLFLGAWQVMIGAMMVPAILPALGHVTGVATARLARPHIEVAFLVAFLGVWAGFGLGAFLGDMVVHRIVDRHRGWRLARGLSKPGSWLPPAGTSSHRASAATWSGADGLADHLAVAVGDLGAVVRLGLQHGIAASVRHGRSCW